MLSPVRSVRAPRPRPQTCMLSSCVALWLLALAGVGCGGARIRASLPLAADDLASINQATRGLEGSVVLVDGAAAPQPVTAFQDVGPDRVDWVEGPPPGMRRSAPLESVSHLVARSGGSGVLVGVGLGFLAGALGGAALGLSATDSYSKALAGPVVVPLTAVLGGLAGSLLGGIFGLAAVQVTVIDFGATPPTRVAVEGEPCGSAGVGTLGNTTGGVALICRSFVLGAPHWVKR